MTEILNNDLLIEYKKLIQQGINELNDKNYSNSKNCFFEAQKQFTVHKSIEYTSVCMSLTALVLYLEDVKNYSQSLEILNDAEYMANYSNNTTAKLFVELVKGNINFSERNSDIAMLHYKNAKKLSFEYDEFSMQDYINTRISQIENGMDFSMPTKSNPLVSLLKIGRSITALTDINVLLKVIAEETKNAIQADRCTVFILDNEKQELWSKVALGMESEEIRFPADKGLAGYVVQTGETINIEDAYNDPRFNKDVDIKSGYHTKSILCMPIKNNNQEIIGAFQVLNKFNGVFTQNDEDLLIAIGGSASIALENAQLFEQQKELYREQKLVFDSFIDTLAKSIDARDKITSGHSSRVKLYTMLIVDALNLPEKEKEIIEKAAILHDIGKIGIRDAVLQKEGKLTDEEYKHIQEHVKITHDILEKIHLSKDFQQITEIACSHHEKWNGSGYYRNLSGENIPYGGRILAVSDVFDAITSKRHYRDKMPINNVVKILLNDSGSHFDKNIVDTFLKIPLDKVIEVFLTESHISFENNDKEILKNYNLLDIYNFINSESSQDIVNMFNHYYAGNE